MSTTLELAFTGICTIVPRREQKMVSVLVSDASESRPALDGEEMAAHEASLVNHGDGGKKYRLPRTLAIGKRTADLDSVRYSGFAPLHDIVPDHRIDRAKLTDGARDVLCRVDLGAGAFVGPGPGAFWTIEPRLDETRIAGGWFSWTATWRIDGVTKAQLAPFLDLEPLGHSSPMELADTGTIRLEIRNLPPDHDHHDHAMLATASIGSGATDDHFRWFYELLSGRDGLKAKLGGGSLPVPVYQTGLMTIMSPGTHTCIGGWGDPGP